MLCCYEACVDVHEHLHPLPSRTSFLPMLFDAWVLSHVLALALALALASVPYLGAGAGCYRRRRCIAC